MKKKVTILLATFLSLLTTGLIFVADYSYGLDGLNKLQRTTKPAYVPGELLVKYRPSIHTLASARYQSRYGISVLRTFTHIGVQHVRLPDDLTVEYALQVYKEDPDVEYAEPNYTRKAFRTPDDLNFEEQWGLNNIGQTGGIGDADIDAPEAWDVQTGNSDVVIAVIDSGIDLEHEDLADNIWRNINEDWSNGNPGNNGVDNDGNGKIDDYYGWDFINGDGEPEDENSVEDMYHGTHISGTIAAKGNNSVGIAGVCWSASIMPLKVINSEGTGSVANEIEAIDYAIENQANIINAGFGGLDESISEYRAIERAKDAGILFVAAAGNYATDIDITPFYPASYDFENIISVAATDHNDELASFSNYGEGSADVAAPGAGIYSTKPGNSYQTLSGTSMATAYVSGLAALIWSKNHTLTYHQVKTRILDGADRLDGLEGKLLTGGRINAYNALTGAHLYFPHTDTTNGWETEIAIINKSSTQTASGSLNAYSNTGQLITAMEVTLGPKARRQITISQELANHTLINHLIFNSDIDTIVGYTKLYKEGIYRAAIPAASEINTSGIYVSHIASDFDWWTKITLLNTTYTQKTLTLTFSTGETRDVLIPAKGSNTFTMRDLFGGPKEDVKSAVITNAGGIAGLELFGSTEGSAYSYLSGILLKDETATTIYYPHIDSNYIDSSSYWWTGIVAYSPPEYSSHITVTAYTKEGTSLMTTDPITINPNGKYIGSVQSLDLPYGTAWIKIDSDNPITGFELFGTHDGKQLGGYTGVGISGKEGVFAKIEKQGWTGIAFVNIGATEASITLTAYDNYGNTVANREFILGSFAKTVSSVDNEFFLGQDISSATYISYSSDKDIVSFQLNGSFDGMMLDGLEGMCGVENTFPTVTITSPSNNSTYNEGDIISFIGSGEDVENGTLTGSSLIWTSSIDSQIGIGASFIKNNLSLGTHTITLTAIDSEGATGSDSVSITIVEKAASDYPYSIVDIISAGDWPYDIAITPNGSYAYVANAGDDTVSVIQTSDNTVVDTISVGGYPLSIATTPNGSYAYVANAWDNTVSVIETSYNMVVNTISVGEWPCAVATTPNGSYAYVANHGFPWGFTLNENKNTVSVIYTPYNTVANTIPVGNSPASIAITPNGSYVYVANAGGDTVSVIQTSNSTVVDTISVGNLGNSPNSIAISPNGSYVYVAEYFDNTVSVIQTSDNMVVDTISLDNGPFAVAITPNGKYVYVANSEVNTVSVIRTSDNTPIDTIFACIDPCGVAISPDGNYVYVTSMSNGTVTVIGF